MTETTQQKRGYSKLLSVTTKNYSICSRVGQWKHYLWGINSTAQEMISAIILLTADYVLIPKHISKTRPMNTHKKSWKRASEMMNSLATDAQKARPIPHRSSCNKQSSHTLSQSLSSNVSTNTRYSQGIPLSRYSNIPHVIQTYIYVCMERFTVFNLPVKILNSQSWN